MDPENHEGRNPNPWIDAAEQGDVLDLTDTDSMPVTDALPAPVSAFSVRMPTGLSGRYRSGDSLRWIALAALVGAVLVIGALVIGGFA